MMQTLLVKKLRCTTPFAFISPIRRLLSTSLPSSESVSENPPFKSDFALEYLVKSCGIPRDKAIKASKRIPNLKSTAKADSALQYLRQIGLGDADIRKAIISEPKILCASVENTLKPALMNIQEVGFSAPQMAQLLSFNPVMFRYKDKSLQKKINFWMPFLGSLEGILNALKRCHYLLGFSVDKVIGPNISFLEGHCGLSPSQIRNLIMRSPSIVATNLSKLKEAARRAENFGSPLGSGMFIYALQIAIGYNPNDLDAKIKNLKKLGFSKDEIDSMIKKMPMLLTNSDERIRKSVVFLTSEVGLDLSYIALHPILISFSLERRIIPRHYVLKSLKARGICENLSVHYVMNSSEKKFEERFVRPYKDIIPEVVEAYEDACAGKISLSGKL